MSQQFQVTVTATGEVRDKDGNLISSTPMESTTVMTEDEMRAAGIALPDQEEKP